MRKICPDCQRTFEMHDGSADANACPECRAGGDARPPEGWTDVARVTNLAEAGFLASDLAGEGIESRVFAAESFNAVAGNWATAYLIQVPNPQAVSAASRLRHHLVDDESVVEPESEFAEGPVDAVLWRPVALLVMAGVASFVLGQRFADQAGARPEVRPRKTLTSAVDAIARPFYTESAPGEPRHRLRYRGRDRTWYLETDSDGDGWFELRRSFPE